MKINKKHTTLLFLLFVFFISRGQTNDNAIRQKVLKNNIVNKTFIFGKWTEKGGTETYLTYLGKVKTKDGKTYKIMNSIWYWGLSHRATSRILIFNQDNTYYGNYGLGMTYEIPDKLENGKLFFTYDKKDNCDCKAKTEINLNNGLPKEIFIKCNKSGDFYSLDIEK